MFCPFISSSEKLVKCSKDCALFTKDNKCVFLKIDDSINAASDDVQERICDLAHEVNALRQN